MNKLNEITAEYSLLVRLIELRPLTQGDSATHFRNLLSFSKLNTMIASRDLQQYPTIKAIGTGLAPKGDTLEYPLAHLFSICFFKEIGWLRAKQVSLTRQAILECSPAPYRGLSSGPCVSAPVKSLVNINSELFTFLPPLLLFPTH